LGPEPELGGGDLRLQLLHALGPERAVELDPFYPAGSPVITPAEGQVSPQALADATGRLLAAYRQAGQWFGQAATAGSNNWVISPGRTATRRPLLANDPHLTVSMPTMWYQNHLHVQGGSLQVSGATIPGLPGVVTGHNARIAWGMTAGRADTQDLYVEQRHPEQPTWFRFGDEWEGAQVYREEIACAARRSRTWKRCSSPDTARWSTACCRPGSLANTPEGQPGLPPLALRWGGHYPSTSLRGHVGPAEG
jgi:penicillin G amidase